MFFSVSLSNSLDAGWEGIDVDLLGNELVSDFVVDFQLHHHRFLERKESKFRFEKIFKPVCMQVYAYA